MAFNDFVRWRQRHPRTRGLCLNINLSVMQVLQEDLLADIQSIAEAAGMNLGQLILEITESIFINDTARAIETIRKLKRLGVSISIDDFGTGYASLHYLNQFDVDLVKIDKVLIDDISCNMTKFSIVSSMLDLCRKLDLKVVAEGIETQGQLEKLRQMRCRLGQGHYFSPPQDMPVIEEMIKNGVTLA